MDSQLARQIFFDQRVHMQSWKDSLASKNEEKLIEVLNNCGYILGKDYFRQFPIGERFVIDIAFPKEQIAIEVDGRSHQGKKQKNIDKKRDRFLLTNNWIPLRIKEEEFFGFKASFYKSLIKLLVDERRKQWEVGNLYAIDIPNFIDDDFE